MYGSEKVNKLSQLNLHTLEVVSRYRNPHLQTWEN